MSDLFRLDILDALGRIGGNEYGHTVQGAAKRWCDVSALRQHTLETQQRAEKSEAERDEWKAKYEARRET